MPISSLPILLAPAWQSRSTKNTDWCGSFKLRSDAETEPEKEF
jgi:hypothetical protein